MNTLCTELAEQPFALGGSLLHKAFLNNLALVCVAPCAPRQLSIHAHWNYFADVVPAYQVVNVDEVIVSSWPFKLYASLPVCTFHSFTLPPAIEVAMSLSSASNATCFTGARPLRVVI